MTSDSSIQTFNRGQLIETRPMQIPAEIVEANRLHEQARQSLQINRDYINDPRLTSLLDAEPGSLTNAQRDRAIQELVRQSVALTRQVNGLIRLTLGQLDDVD